MKAHQNVRFVCFTLCFVEFSIFGPGNLELSRQSAGELETKFAARCQVGVGFRFRALQISDVLHAYSYIDSVNEPRSE